jgi:hypothetical protein
MKAPLYRATQTAVGSTLHRAILDATRNLGAAVLARRDPHDPVHGILVATDGVDGWFDGNLAHHVPTHPLAPPKKAMPRFPPCHGADPWFQPVQAGSPQGASDGRRNGRPGGSRSLRKK